MESTDALYTLIPLADFQAISGMDERENKLTRFVLVIATYSIEQYCKRRFPEKNHTEYLDYVGDELLLLREYPVKEVKEVHISLEHQFTPESLLPPDQYSLIPEGEHGEPEFPFEDIPYHLVLKPSSRYVRGEKCVKVKYLAGYRPEEVPPDLASACLELAAWNMTRYRGRRIGMTGNVRGSGKDGEHLEASMPENVRQLLEPYRRRAI
jgi:hypothetical protein